MRPTLFATRLFIGIFFYVLVIEQTALAAPSSSGLYGLDEVIVLAIERHPSIAEANGMIAQQRGERVIAGAYPNPSIKGFFGPGVTREQLGNVSVFERAVIVNQPLEWPGMRQARQRASDAGVDAAFAGFNDTRLKVSTDAKVAFYQLLLAQRDVELSTQSLGIVQDLFQSIKARVEAGQARPFESLKAGVEVQKVSKDLSRAQNNLVVARVRLNMGTGGALGEDFAVRGDFVQSPGDFGLQTLIERSLEQHPLIGQLKKQIEKAGHSVVKERNSLIPNITVSGEYHAEAAEKAYLALISVPIPLWYQRQGEIAAALGTMERAKAERTRSQNELVTAITEQVQEARTATQQIEVFEKGLLKQADETLRIARISFQQGATGLLDLIDAQRVYRQMLLEYAQARADLSVALVRLERWTGGVQ
ncbi:MAG: hypothetical protein OJF50_006585 [Nitrospira sp.]|nr:hypothetical protein [Nitrospira sp.]